jgi:uncharacterized protein YndB with AHSA1/START domain
VIEGTRVVHEVRYPHPPERVWRALTDPAELFAWLMPNDFTPEEGARFRLDARPDHAEPFDCEVLEVDPPHRLRTRWIIRGKPTIVTFALRADDGGTVLRVEHEGLSTSERPNFDGGWGAKFAVDLPAVLNGERDRAAATRDATGLTHHPAYVPVR